MNLPAHGRSLILVPILCATLVHAQALDFQLQTHTDCPVALLNFAPSTIRSEADRRRFLTVKNESDKIAAAVVFQQTIGSGPGAEIVTIERVSIVMRPRETKRLSVSVRDVSNRFQAAIHAGEAAGKPVLSVAVVEFTDGTAWHAPLILKSETR
jgi:hypothetical protein